MSTHVANKPPSTRITLSEGAAISVDTLNVNKEIPKEVFNRYIPKNFPVNYSDIDSDTLVYSLTQYADKDFLNHFNLFVDDTLIQRTVTLDQSLSQYKINGSLNAIELSSTLYQSLNEQTSTILLVYTPA